MIYTSKQNPLIKEIASLKDKKGRAKLGLYIAEGVKMVNEAIKNNLPIKMIVVTDVKYNEINKTNCEIITVSQEVFNYLSDEITPQGALAVIEIFKGDIKPPKNNALILDGVSDPGNMGTIIRTAAALGYNDLYLINCVDPYMGKVVRASMSGIYFVNLYKCDLNSCLDALKGHKIIVADMKGKSVNDYKINGKFAIAVGNEANGISNDLYLKASEVVSIPMESTSESLNVAVCAGILMYKFKY